MGYATQAFGFTNGVGIHAVDFNSNLYPDLYFSNYQEADDQLFFSEDALAAIEFGLKSQFRTYPNLVVDAFTIEADLLSSYSSLNIRLCDVSGKVVNELFGIESSNNHLYVELNISSLNSGTYFYTVFNEITKLFNNKLIKLYHLSMAF